MLGLLLLISLGALGVFSEGFFKPIVRGFSLGQLPVELVRLKGKNSTADTSKLIIVPYPSDSFLLHVAASLALNGKLLVIK